MRLVLVLYLEDMSLVDIAESLDMSENAVSIQLHRAKEKLLKVLGE